MGRLKNTVLGNITGKVGDIVFRVRGKKSYLYASPKKVKVSQKQEAKEARSKFNPLSKFGSFINSIPELKYFNSGMEFMNEPNLDRGLNLLLASLASCF